MVFDLQDVGVRFFTYISTLTLVMESCAAERIPLIVLDRPNPNGFYVDGPVLDRNFSSFVGMHPVPVVYGMTIGEYSKMVNGEGWLPNGLKCSLSVVPVAGYTHAMHYRLPVRPSPNLPSETSILLYPSLCLFEGTVISVGRGTITPFQVYGHPELKYGSYEFTPVSLPGVSLHPPYEGTLCYGEDLGEYYTSHPQNLGQLNLTWLIRAYGGVKNSASFFNDYFNKLAGNATLQQQIRKGIPENQIRKSWQQDIEKFKRVRKKYLLY